MEEPVRQQVEAIASLHRATEGNLPPQQRAVERLTAGLGQPSALLALGAVLLAWIAVNLVPALRWDPPPFPMLQTVVGVLALFLTATVLVTQRRQVQAEERRARLNLHITMLVEEKVTKIIALLEELRRDTPAVRDRHDEVAQAMAKSTDAKEVLAALDAQLGGDRREEAGPSQRDAPDGDARDGARSPPSATRGARRRRE
jgi:uncharacterized membrane protein